MSVRACGTSVATDRRIIDGASCFQQSSRVSIPPPPPNPAHRPAEGECVEVAFKGDDGSVDAWWEVICKCSTYMMWYAICNEDVT
jgi:hypothetical protein